MDHICALIALMKELCEQTERICHIRQGLHTDFYERLQSQMVEIQKTVAEEIWKQLDVSGKVKEGIPLGTEEGMGRLTEAEPMEDSIGPILPEEIFTEEPFVTKDANFPDDFAAVLERENEAVLEANQKELSEPVAVQVGPSKWLIKDGAILCQTQDVTITRDGRQESIRFHISPLEKAENGIVPILVGSEYQSTYGARQANTAMSENGDSLLQVDINDYSFLVKGSFEGGVFSTSIATTGKSIGCGDVLAVDKIYPVSGTEAVPLIVVDEKTRLWISFFEEQYFGMLHSGEWLDEYNSTHDAMVEVGDDYSELRTSRTESGWSLEY